MKFGLYLAIFHFSGFGLFETAYGQIWQPCRERTRRREREIEEKSEKLRK
jgi:hypothetical protein